MKAILAYSIGYRKYLVLLPLVVLCDVICEVLLPLFMAEILNESFTTGNIDIIAKKGVIMAVLAIILTLVGFLQSYCVSKFSSGLTRNLREITFKKALDLSIEDAAKFGSASLMTRLTVDANAIKKAAGMTASLIKCPILIIMTSIMATRINLSLSWIFFSVLPVFIVILLILNKIARRHYKAMFIHYEGMNTVLDENVASIKTVKAFVRERQEIENFTVSAGKVRSESKKAETITALNSSLLQFVANLTILMIVYFGGLNMINATLDPGDLFCLITYANQILTQVWIISLLLIPILSAQVSFTRMKEVINTKPGVNKTHTDNALMPKNGSIDFKNVSFCYDKNKNDKPQLKDISISIPHGGFIGVTGVSGSSKTTLINLIPRLCDCSKGAVYIAGKDVREYDPVGLRTCIAVVPQKSVLFSGTIAENLRFGNGDASTEELLEALRVADAYNFVTGFTDGLDTILYHGGSNLSGGQRQRLCIARALIRKPKILILDDSLSAVDKGTEARIVSGLLENNKDMTVILVSLRLQAIQNAHKIMVMDAGNLVGCGTHQELIENNLIYKELNESQRRHMNE